MECKFSQDQNLFVLEVASVQLSSIFTDFRALLCQFFLDSVIIATELKIEISNMIYFILGENKQVHKGLLISVTIREKLYSNFQRNRENF